MMRTLTTLRALIVPAVLAAVPAAAPFPAHAEEVTTLEEISIEGEVRLPRVLFITSRDIARPLDFLDHYAPDPLALLGPAPEPGPLPVLNGPLALGPPAPGRPAPGAPAAPGTAPGTVVPATPATPENPSSPDPHGSSKEVQQ